MIGCGHGVFSSARGRSTMTGVPGARSPSRSTVTRPSVGPSASSNRLERPGPRASTRAAGRSSAERSRCCEPGGRGSRLKPPPASEACCGCRRREPQRGVRHEHRVGHLRHGDFGRGRHAGLQQPLGVVDGQHGLVGDDAVRRLRRAADFLDARFERPVGIRVHAEARGLADAARCRCRLRRRR